MLREKNKTGHGFLLLIVLAVVAAIWAATAVHVSALENGAYLVGRTTSYADPRTGQTVDGGTDIALGDSMCASIIQDDVLIEKVDGILLDLGVSSYQIDEASRGFSYLKNDVLDMRMDKTIDLTARDIINNYSEEKLIKIFYEYGEERFSKQIAKNICEYRVKKSIDTTLELVGIIEKSVPSFAKKDGHTAKRVFQAIRIVVNNEIEPLYNTIKDCIKLLSHKGRLCVITFHSLEDRAVKNAYNDSIGKCICPKDLPYCVCNRECLGKIINKKPIVANEEEQKINPRSKSAKLRIFEKI